MRKLLDTNICVAYLHRGEKDVVEKFAQAKPRELVMCSIVKAEMLYGARRSQRVEDNLQRLAKFFASFESLAFDDRAADFYGTHRALLARGGTPIGDHDLLISAIALAHNLVVVTRNRKEFARVPGLRVEVW